MRTMVRALFVIMLVGFGSLSACIKNQLDSVPYVLI